MEGADPAAAALRGQLASETAKSVRLQVQLSEARAAQSGFLWQVGAAIATGALVAAVLRH